MQNNDEAVEALSRARLQRFYGGDPLAWEDMPLKRLNEFADALPIIDADERLAYIVDTAVGSGAAKKHFAARHQRQLRRLADRIPGRRRKLGKFDKAMLEAMHIKVD